MANIESGKPVRRFGGSRDMAAGRSDDPMMDLGDIRLVDEEQEEAPDMAAVKDKPTPPPPPASAQQPAGRSSLEEKTTRRKRTPSGRV